MVKRLMIYGCLLMVLVACNLTTSQPTPFPTPNIPTVEILDPPNNRQVVEDTDFDIDIVGSDSTIGVSKIELYVDGELINTATPFSNVTEPIFRVQMNWLARGVGLHIIEAVAWRPDGQRSDSALINIEVMAKPQ